MKTVPKFLALVVAFVLTLAGSASALTLRITDRDLQGLIAQGSSDGNRLNLQIAASASGPVMVFVIDGSSVTSYRAELRGGQVILEGQGGTTLARLLAGRGVTLTTEVVDTSNPRSFSLPGLGNSASPVNTPSVDFSNPLDGPRTSGNGNGGGKGKDNGKDKEDKKEKAPKEKGKP